eukprot:1884259-Heterocapsa_arctica.AAC.1
MRSSRRLGMGFGISAPTTKNLKKICTQAREATTAMAVDSHEGPKETLGNTSFGTKTLCTTLSSRLARTDTRRCTIHNHGGRGNGGRGRGGAEAGCLLFRPASGRAAQGQNLSQNGYGYIYIY